MKGVEVLRFWFRTYGSELADQVSSLSYSVYLQNWSGFFGRGGGVRFSSIFPTVFVRFFARPNLAFKRL